VAGAVYPDHVPRWQRVYLVACAAVIGFALAVVLCQFAGWPRYTYHPYRRTGAWLPPGGSQVTSTYLGVVAWGVIGALVAGVAALAGSGFARAPLSTRALSLVGGWALTAVALAAGFALWMLWPF
jgi:hypothetical protein